jgi:integrase
MDTMLKRDPYNSKFYWNQWKQQNADGIKGISRHNSDLIKTFLYDMEIGKNVAPTARKGERSHCRLLALKSRLLFFAQRFTKLDEITEDDIHQLFRDMREGRILKENGKPYIGVSSYVRDFKSFWRWLQRTGKVQEDITVYLRRSDGRKPAWVYLTEEQFKTLANSANADYRPLIWFMYDTGIRVTEAYSIRVKDFKDDFNKLHIREEYSKTMGRTITLKLCTMFIKEHIRTNGLGPDDFIFTKKPFAFNKYLRSLAGKLFGSQESPARKSYDKMRLYDIRHNACCYWLQRYPNRTGLMYRMGWSEEKEIKYYSEFLGLSDQISDDDMITTEDKTAYEKRIEVLERRLNKVNEFIKLSMAKKINAMSQLSEIEK